MMTSASTSSPRARGRQWCCYLDAAAISLDFDAFAADIAKSGFRVLRPQPRGAGKSEGPMQNSTLHDFARDIAAVIRHQGNTPAVIVGHAFGNWVGRMTATDTPDLVRGVVIVAAAAKAYPAGFAGAKELSDAVKKAGDLTRPEAERLEALRFAFFAPGHDARVWLSGWHPDVDESQFAAGRATKQSEWWPGGKAPLLDVQAELDPFKPRSMANEIKEEFGDARGNRRDPRRQSRADSGATGRSYEGDRDLDRQTAEALERKPRAHEKRSGQINARCAVR